MVLKLSPTLHHKSISFQKASVRLFATGSNKNPSLNSSDCTEAEANAKEDNELF
jgi:hypothetical protein